MTCDSRSSRELRLRSPPSASPEPEGCCSGCNSQVCSSYLVGLLACLLVVGGVFLAFQRWDYMWLGVTAVGVALVFVGAMLHYCGTGTASNRQQEAKRLPRHLELGQNEHLLPANANLNPNYSVSQLSLNMLPPYFPTYDSMSVTSNPGGPPNVVPASNNRASVISTSQIMQINGVSFLLLPIGNEDDAQSLAASKITSGSLLQLQTQDSEIGADSTRSFIVISPNHLGIPASDTAQPVTPSKAVAQVQTSDLSGDLAVQTGEPIYQVPSSLLEIPNGSDSVDSNPTGPTTSSTEVVVPEASISTAEDLSALVEDTTMQNESVITELEASRPVTPENEEEDDDVQVCPPSYEEVAIARNKSLGMPKFAYETM